MHQFFFALGCFMAVSNQFAHGRATVRFTGKYVDEHSVRNFESRGQRFGRGFNQTPINTFVPRNKSPFGRFPFDKFLSGLRRLCCQFGIFNHVCGSLCDNKANIIKSFAARSTSNLMKISSGENRRFVARIFAKLSKKNGSNRNIDANSQRICAADDFEQSLLRQLFDKNPVFRQESCVVQTNSHF